jgi:hypothetical protein
MNRSLGWLWGQFDEFLGRQALVQPRTSHRHRLEGATIAPFVTISAGSGLHLLDSRTIQTVVLDGLRSQGRRRGEAGSEREPSLSWLMSVRRTEVINPAWGLLT